MGRWQADSRGRLQEGALALYSERGFDQAAAAQIAARAGLTERTFFRGTVALVDRGERETGEVTSSGSVSVFAGFRFPVSGNRYPDMHETASAR